MKLVILFSWAKLGQLKFQQFFTELKIALSSSLSKPKRAIPCTQTTRELGA